MSAIRRSCEVTPSVASQTTSATSARSAARCGAQRRVVLDRLRDLGRAADAGRVDEQQLAAVDLDRRVDRVARRARDVGDDHALAAEEGVDERGLADVRAPDHREAHELLLQLLVLVLGQHLDEAVEQVAGAEPLRRRDGQRLAQPEAVEVVHERDVARRVDLVGGQHDRQAAAAQHLGHLGVAGAHAGARVDHEQRDVGVRRAPRAPGRGSRRRAAPCPRGRRRRCRSARRCGRSSRWRAPCGRA